MVFGQVFRVNICAVCPLQADIGIILDHSTSIVNPSGGGYDNWEVHMLGFITELIGAFPIGPTQTRVGIVSFSSNARLTFGFNAYNDSQTLITAVRQIEIQGGETHMAEVTIANVALYLVSLCPVAIA